MELPLRLALPFVLEAKATDLAGFEAVSHLFQDLVRDPALWRGLRLQLAVTGRVSKTWLARLASLWMHVDEVHLDLRFCPSRSALNQMLGSFAAVGHKPLPFRFSTPRTFHYVAGHLIRLSKGGTVATLADSSAYSILGVHLQPLRGTVVMMESPLRAVTRPGHSVHMRFKVLAANDGARGREGCRVGLTLLFPQEIRKMDLFVNEGPSRKQNVKEDCSVLSCIERVPCCIYADERGAVTWTDAAGRANTLALAQGPDWVRRWRAGDCILLRVVGGRFFEIEVNDVVAVSVPLPDELRVSPAIDLPLWAVFDLSHGVRTVSCCGQSSK